MIGKSMRRRLLLLILIIITMKNKIKKIILLIIYMIVCDIMIYYDICIKKYFCSKLTHDCKCLKAWNTCSRRHKYENFSYMFDSLNFPTIKFSSKTKRGFFRRMRGRNVSSMHPAGETTIVDTLLFLVACASYSAVGETQERGRERERVH